MKELNELEHLTGGKIKTLSPNAAFYCFIDITGLIGMINVFEGVEKKLTTSEGKSFLFYIHCFLINYLLNLLLSCFLGFSFNYRICNGIIKMYWYMSCTWYSIW